MSGRILRINELLRQEVNQLILTELEFPRGCLVTIVKVETSKDLKHSKIYISILPVKFTSKVLNQIKKKLGHIQYLLRKKLSLKPLPRLMFVVDRTEKEAYDIEMLLDSIKNKS